MKIRLALVAVITTSAVALSGCGMGTEASSVSDEPKAGTNYSEDTAGEEPAEETPAENPKFGETVIYPDGLQITVKKGKPFKPGEYAAVSGTHETYMAYEVVVVNGTKSNFDPSMMFFTMQSRDEEGEEVFDSDNGFDGTPMTKLLPGRQSKFKVGFGIKDKTDQVMQVETGTYEHDSTIYTN